MISSPMNCYEACVVGAGLIGSATAKYLATHGVRTCLIGPNKAEKEDVQKRRIFETWNDVTRISHVLFPDVVWAYLAKESIQRYRSIEEEAGIKFFTDTGYLVLSDSSTYVKANVDVARQIGIADDLQLYSSKAQLEERFPCLRFAADSNVEAVFERRNAGLLNPIKLVEAQRLLFVKYGGTLLDDVVTRVQRNAADGPFTIKTESGHDIYAKKVVICAGAFVRHHNLLPDDCRLDISVRPSLVARIRLNPDSLLHSLMSTPPLIYIPAASSLSVSKTSSFSSAFYTASPILYPDGHYYLKIGYLDDTSKFENRTLDTSDSITAIFTNNNDDAEEKSNAAKHLLSIAKSIFKGCDSDHVEADACCWVNTPTGRPYLGEVAPDWFVVTGDNGFSAKSSDEIGRLAAEMALQGKLSSQFSFAEDVRPKFLSSTGHGQVEVNNNPIGTKPRFEGNEVAPHAFTRGMVIEK